MLEIQTKQLQPDIVVLEIAGRITIGRDCKHLEWAVESLARELRKKVIFDLTGVTYIDSTGIGIIANVTRQKSAAWLDFFAPWELADPDIPILKEAKAEYAKLQQPAGVQSLLTLACRKALFTKARPVARDLPKPLWPDPGHGEAAPVGRSAIAVWKSRLRIRSVVCRDDGHSPSRRCG